MKKIMILLIPVIAVIIAVVMFLSMKKSAPVAAQVQETPDSLAMLVSKVKGYEDAGDLLKAKAVYQQMISEYPNSKEVQSWQRKVEDNNIKMMFSPNVNGYSVLYEIKAGDNLTKIASEFNTTIELIKISNNISDDKIFPGKKIKVWNRPFSIVVDKSQNTLILKTGEEVVKTYTVSTGANNSTPVGNFKVINRIKDPTWYKAGAVVPPGSPENVLGSHWLGLDVTGYGIHGTTEPQSLGKQVTQGCVRMANKDVEELFNIVPAGTEVTIVD